MSHRQSRRQSYDDGSSAAVVNYVTDEATALRGALSVCTGASASCNMTTTTAAVNAVASGWGSGHEAPNKAITLRKERSVQTVWKAERQIEMRSCYSLSQHGAAAIAGLAKHREMLRLQATGEAWQSIKWLLSAASMARYGAARLALLTKHRETLRQHAPGKYPRFQKRGNRQSGGPVAW